MLKEISINQSININKLDDGKLVISSPSKTFILDQPILQAIIFHLITGPRNMMGLVESLAERYPPTDVMRSINALKHYDIIVSGDKPISIDVHDSFLNLTNTNNSLLNYFGNSELVGKFINGEPLLSKL